MQDLRQNSNGNYQIEIEKIRGTMKKIRSVIHASKLRIEHKLLSLYNHFFTKPPMKRFTQFLRTDVPEIFLGLPVGLVMNRFSKVIKQGLEFEID